MLSNDLVGNTFWIKLVDIVCTQLSRRVALLLMIEKTSNRGVIWDQEIYDNFTYNQDRTFFHSFELEECLAGLSFADEKEAKQLVPDQAKQLGTWRRQLRKAPSEKKSRGHKLTQVQRLQALSVRAEYLWSLVIERLRISERT